MRTRSGIWNLRWETYAEKKLRLNNKKNINVLKDKEVIFSDITKTIQRNIFVLFM